MRDPPFSFSGGNMFSIADILMLKDSNDRILENHFMGWVNGSKRKYQGHK